MISHYHGIEAASAQDLATIEGPDSVGFTLILRRAAFSEDITVTEDGNIVLLDTIDDEFEMFTDGDQLWLMWDGTSWIELSRFEQ